MYVHILNLAVYWVQEGGSLGELSVAAGWRVMVFWLYDFVDRPSDHLCVRTIPLSGCMDR